MTQGKHENLENQQAGSLLYFFKGGIMPKLKTHKGAAKRFRLTATGKVKRGHSHVRHILTKKTAKRKRQLDIDVMVSEADTPLVKKMLPYGRG